MVLFKSTLSLISLFFLLPTLINSTCDNFGTTLASGLCSCPSGSGGNNCTDLVCSNPVLAPSSRTKFNPLIAGSNGSSGCGTQCSSGFGGKSSFFVLYYSNPTVIDRKEW